MSKIKLIYAISLNGFIGKDGAMPWHIPEDFERFKALTQGQAILMGRKTWESLPKRPLTDRVNVVVTTNPTYDAYPGFALLTPSVERHIAFHRVYRPDLELWVIGGQRVYEEALPFADEVHVTQVDTCIDGDATAPTDAVLRAAGFVRLPLNDSDWLLSRKGLRYRFVTWSKAQCAVSERTRAFETLAQHGALPVPR